MSEAAAGAKLVLGPPRHEFVGSATVQIWTCAPGVEFVRVAGKADVDVARELARDHEKGSRSSEPSRSSATSRT